MDKSNEFPGRGLVQRFLSFLCPSPGKSRTMEKTTDSGCEFDYINELPDEILVEILSKLTVKEVARACIVSRRWRTFSTTYEEASSSHSMRCGEYEASGAMVVRCRERISTLDSAILVFDLSDPRDYSTLNKWIQTALCKYKVQSFEVPGLGSLGLFHSHSISSAPGIQRNARLTALHLNTVNMTSLDLDDLFASCPDLETLTLENLPQVRSARVGYGGNSDKLKHLEIRYCLNLENICIISAPNLVSLKLAREGGGVFFFYGEFSKLSSISLEGTFSNNVVSETQRAAPLLEQVELNMDLIHWMSVAPSLEFPEFKNVRTLKLIFDFSSEATDLMNLVLIILACPSLQKLTLMFRLRKECRENDNVPTYIHFDESGFSFRHERLQVVEFLGWCGCQNEVRLADFVIKIAIHLEDLVLDPVTPQHVDRSGAQTFRQGDPMDKNALASANLITEKFQMNKSSRP